MAPGCIYISCFETAARSGSGRDSVRGSVGAMNAKLSRPDGLATVQSGRKQAQSRVCTPGFRPTCRMRLLIRNSLSIQYNRQLSVKPGVHTNDFAPIHRLRALKLGHASLATVFRPGRLTLQPILRENLESPVLRYQPITTAVVTDACLNTRWHHGAYTSAVLRESLGLDRVVTVYVA